MEKLKKNALLDEKGNLNWLEVGIYIINLTLNLIGLLDHQRIQFAKAKKPRSHDDFLIRIKLFLLDYAWKCIETLV